MQGYITLACGHDRYLQQAINLALSAKLNDPGRPICLVHDEMISIDATVRRVFDHLVSMPTRPGFVGCMNKVRVYDFSPYDETFYIDADCLIVKNDMDRHWRKFAMTDFNIAGTKRLSGKWYDFDIAEICRQLTIRYVVQMNSGAFYFRKSAEGKRVFDVAIELFERHRDIIGSIHQKRKDQYADEPFFAAAMGKLELEPVGYTPEEGSIMITTLYARRCHFDPFTRESSIEKPSGFWLLNRFFAKRWVRHSPTIAHFIGLKPQPIYNGAVRALRAKAGLADIAA